MILTYILKSSLALMVLFAFYRYFLENEKMHHFNRAYLLSAIVLSLVVPLLPTGMVLFEQGEAQTAAVVLNGAIEISEGGVTSAEQSMYSPWMLGGAIYTLIFVLFGIKFGRNLFLLFSQVRGNRTMKYNGARLVLLDHAESPYTFMNYIFLSRDDYERKAMDERLLDHELTHVQQRHSWDILFMEVVILIFWFNPILRWYKTAIQLNHEFLADDSVIEKHKTIKSYQYLLLDTIQHKNKIYLASNINFHLTQKRLLMMTKTSSSMRKKILIFSIVPIVLGLLLCCGSPVIAQSQNIQQKEQAERHDGIDKDAYFENAVIQYTTKDGQVVMKKYKSLDASIKARISPPPPPPPSIGASSAVKKSLDPLPKGTVVYLSKDGKVHIGGAGDIDKVPPPPPPPPRIPEVREVKPHKVPKPPKPPKAPKPPKPEVMDVKPPTVAVPPPPPPPPSIEEMMEDAEEFYVDGKKVKKKEVREMLKEDQNDIKCIDVKEGKNGKMSMHVTLKKYKNR